MGGGGQKDRGDSKREANFPTYSTTRMTIITPYQPFYPSFLPTALSTFLYASKHASVRFVTRVEQ